MTGASDSRLDGSATDCQRRVLFVCTGNTCRSVLAEYLGRKFLSSKFRFESAGIRPQKAEDADNAIFILRDRFNIDASAHQPRDVRDVDVEGFDLVIAIGDNAAAFVKAMGVPEPKVTTWAISDPWGGDLTEYDAAALAIRKKLARLA